TRARGGQAVNEGEGSQSSRDILFLNSRRVRDAVQIECMEGKSKDTDPYVLPELLTYVTDINRLYVTKNFFKTS
ncbi:unnamed protein product, partial [Amoebophrya sp. A120]